VAMAPLVETTAAAESVVIRLITPNRYLPLSVRGSQGPFAVQQPRLMKKAAGQACRHHPFTQQEVPYRPCALSASDPPW
jgi:hypothetical protein